ncbi:MULTISPECIES: TIGR04283 family arsenosugar biosynthesis glycosyltransferase [unclassified Ruegeria]|uniref:TIGR04283 family arsenosugar biosynthesis glycosyltransferase n=1 Tax=unclassified Ruegeria TaxID=2625375 RepID=UPI001ADD518C|nr:TIGR04283 family arsenosugar biosynthesis glycosyltransferase [Ruegeria sp. R8_1]MBO9414532.1 TIGR04283 family arsenosugar biosynthesis glycosyltransferase [Ruegeria sp. R8_2]
MPAPISIVIPTLNAAETLPATLQALMEGLHTGLIRELIVTDGGSTDPTLEIADEAGAEIVTGAASRGGQLRRGCKQARGEWLLVLHADTVLEDGWTKVVGDHLRSGKPAVFRLAFRAAGFAPGWVAGWANLRSRVLGLPYGDQGLLIPRRTYEQAGGFPDQPLMEDVALMRRVRGVAILPSRAFTSADRYQKAGWMRRGARNLWTLLQYFLGADPAKLARAYRR